MECTMFEEGLGNIQFPTVTTQGGGMEQYCYEVEFIVSGVFGEQQCWPNFCRQPKVDYPDFTPVCGGHLPPPCGRASMHLRVPTGCRDLPLHFQWPTPIASRARPAVRIPRASATH